MNDDLTTNDDAALSAYLDGELSQDEADRLSERLAREPGLARRLEAMRASDEATRKLFARVDELPLPQGVRDMLTSKSAVPPHVVPFPVRAAKQFWQAPVAIAASMALLAGFLARDLLFDQAPRAAGLDRFVAGDVVIGTELHRLLETGQSGVQEQFAGNIQGELLLTFQDIDGDFCRQLRLVADNRSLQAVACRRAGGWQMEATDYGHGTSAHGQYQQASSGGLVNAAVDELIGDNEPLDAVDELRLIRNGWKKIDF